MADTMREKLIELLDYAKHKYREYEENKDHKMRTAKTEAEFDAEASTYEIRHSFYARELIANGVTVQKWIPVTERLPEKGVLVLCIGPRGGMFIGNPSLMYDNEDTAYTYVPNSRQGRYTKYWMPLPKPPKEE